MDNVEITIGGVVVEPLEVPLPFKGSAYAEIDLENKEIKLEDMESVTAKEIPNIFKEKVDELLESLSGLELRGVRYTKESVNRKGNKIQITFKEE